MLDNNEINFCKNCGARRSQSFKYCLNCGTKYSERATMFFEPEVIETQEEQNNVIIEQKDEPKIEPKAEIKYCRNCGMERIPEDIYCIECGVKYKI